MHIQAGRRILITGFGPFPGVRDNPSQWLIGLIDSGAIRIPPGILVSTAVLPTSWQAVAEMTPELFARHQPDIALHFGLHGRAGGFRIEQVARNRAKHLPDVDGKLPSCTSIRRNGARALRSPVAGEKITAPLRSLGLNAKLSNDAGNYLCNMLFYLSLLENREQNSPGSSLFVHIPPASTVAGKRALIKGAESIIRACVIHARPRKTRCFQR